MNIPNMPHINDGITAKGETMNPAWYRFFQQLVTEMQNNLSQEGISVPSQSSSNISKLQDASPSPSLVYNQDEKKYLLPVDGVYKTITLT